MPFEEGKSGNINGKPKGAQNKTTKELKEFVLSFISGNLETMQRDFDSLEPKERLIFLDKLMRFVLPTTIKQEVSLTDYPKVGLDAEEIYFNKF